MTSAAAKKDFAERYLTAPDEGPFSFEGREWVWDHLWNAADRYHLWANDPDKLCTKCRKLHGTVVDWKKRHTSTYKAHKKKYDCEGLYYAAIVCTVIYCHRQRGKTMGAAGYSVMTAYKQSMANITYIASAEDQAKDIFEENFEGMVTRNAKLDRNADVIGNSIYVTQTKSKIQYLSTSPRSITGRGRTHVIIDEARDIRPKVAMALMPSVFAQKGLLCPDGHERHKGDPESERMPNRCDQCNKALVPWQGRLIIMSSAGETDGSDFDWFNDLKERLEKDPDPNYHLFVMGGEAARGKHLNTEAMDAIDRVFGAIDSTRHYVAVEVHNKAASRGDDWITKEQFEAGEDPDLLRTAGWGRPCVAFLDTSLSQELTSLVIIGDDEADPGELWDELALCHLKVWRPSNLPNGLIDDVAVWDHLDEILPRFPGLRLLAVDTKGMPWAANLVKLCKTGKRDPLESEIARSMSQRGRLQRRAPWCRKVKAHKVGREERNAGYTLFEQHVLSGTMRYPPNADLRKESRAARRHNTADGHEIREQSRKKRHLDILEGVACALYYIHLEALKKSKGPAASLMKGKSAARKMLDRKFRGHVRNLGPDSF